MPDHTDMVRQMYVYVVVDGDNMRPWFFLRLALIELEYVHVTEIAP